ncbi:RusA family crossover junction endodeoxyribonuclease [Helcococcus kunzii]|uniref:RusA family crossover junction endodeoxyribonuclease n=1 Tax=Helcococcus kunzii TaxID=40091 RepID=UPI001BB07601|nr:RusA family crossover junction endodeoxyribonuclease [Helcococcus kunzii]QUY65113.1 RusA family crossover junction endodeoxyribonuclease [Helcococcus kunzii]
MIDRQKNNNIEFFIPLKKVPSITAQQKRVTWNHKKNKPIFYDSEKLKDVKEMFRAHTFKYAPKKPFTGPIRLVVKWCYKTKDLKKIGTLKITKPDTDNLIKALKDSMTLVGYWKDDAQVASEINEKYWDYISGVYIYIQKVEE